MNILVRLNDLIARKQSHLCVGLDPDPKKMPAHLKSAGDFTQGDLLSFCVKIVQETCEHAVVYKPNQAFFARIGAYEELKKLIDFIHRSTECLVVLDAKRGDIGNTARFYAEEIFGYYEADGVTVNAYLGPDTLEPWLDWGPEKLVYVLCHTSNKQAGVFQEQLLANTDIEEMCLFQLVAREVLKLQTDKSAAIGLVMGATFPKQLDQLWQAVSQETPLLIPGVGSQGGELEETVKRCSKSPFLINSSGGIIHSSSGLNFDCAARSAALQLKEQITRLLGAV